MCGRLMMLLAAIMMSAGVAFAQTKSAKSIKQQKAATQREISETTKKIKDNKSETRRQLNELNSITAEIGEHQRSIDALNVQLQAINDELRSVNDSIAVNEAELQRLRTEYGNAIRKIHAHSSSLDKLMFIFQSESFHQAMRRMRYLREFSAWRKRQSQEIGEMQQRLIDSRERINRLATAKSNTIKDQNLAKLALEQKKHKQSGIVDKLRSEGAQLQVVLAEKQRKANALDRELNRIIEQERLAAEKARREADERKRLEAERKAADNKKLAEKNKAKTKDKVSDESKSQSEGDLAVSKPKNTPSPSKPAAPTHVDVALGGSFESNKGRLPYPVSGNFKIVRHFGVQRHPELKYVMTENGGIDIETKPGAVARAVFTGKVSAIFRQDGYNTVVMVRHGSYLTIYVNLSEIYVRTGETVKPNQNIGKIFSDREDNNRTILHFEVRKEKAKLNPEQWLRR
ncbi:MAG: peptidoglycan DD-metalloendopeptidase family protein [Muribaculaceae bacterium]